jgi:phosphoribosyl 1,2-cyclic phosphodiesterase
MAVILKFWGTRGSIPTPGDRTRKYGGNTPCVEIRWKQATFVIDAGSGVRELGIDLTERTRTTQDLHFFFSHMHWDHIQGFPFFQPAYQKENRIRIYGKSKGDERFYKLVSGQMQSDYFPVDFHSLRAEIIADHLDQGRKLIEGVEVDTIELNHPGGCLGYRFDGEGRRIVYASDNELAAEPVPGDGIRDIPEDLITFARDADLLIADAQYMDAEYAGRKGWGHSSCLAAVDWAVRARVKRLALFHHDPNRPDRQVEVMVEACQARVKQLGSALQVLAAAEGEKLVI